MSAALPTLGASSADPLVDVTELTLDEFARRHGDSWRQHPGSEAIARTLQERYFGGISDYASAVALGFQTPFLVNCIRLGRPVGDYLQGGQIPTEVKVAAKHAFKTMQCSEFEDLFGYSLGAKVLSSNLRKHGAKYRWLDKQGWFSHPTVQRHLREQHPLQLINDRHFPQLLWKKVYASVHIFWIRRVKQPDVRFPKRLSGLQPLHWKFIDMLHPAALPFFLQELIHAELAGRKRVWSKKPAWVDRLSEPARDVYGEAVLVWLVQKPAVRRCDNLWSHLVQIGVPESVLKWFMRLDDIGELQTALFGRDCKPSTNRQTIN